jgi:hypothetical protein
VNLHLKRIQIGAALAVATIALTGCSHYNDVRGKGDSPVGPVDRTRAEITNFPDGFANVATKCDGHGHRLYVTTRGDQRPAQLTVLVDASCPGGAAK